MSCKYANFFGAPGTGAHAYRIFNVAIVDLLMTILAAKLVAWYWAVSFLKTTLAFLALGVFFHYIFCVKTTFNTFLGLA